MKKLSLLILGFLVAHGSANAVGPVINAVFDGEPSFVSNALRAGANVNETYLGMTALHYAVERPGAEYLDIVRTLLEAGANTDLQDPDGKTALQVANPAAALIIIEYKEKHPSVIDRPTAIKPQEPVIFRPKAVRPKQRTILDDGTE